MWKPLNKLNSDNVRINITPNIITNQLTEKASEKVKHKTSPFKDVTQ